MGYEGEVDVVTNPRPTDVKRHFADNEKLKSMIEFNPIDLEIAMGKVVDWYRRKGI